MAQWVYHGAPLLSSVTSSHALTSSYLTHSFTQSLWRHSSTVSVPTSSSISLPNHHTNVANFSTSSAATFQPSFSSASRAVGTPVLSSDASTSLFHYPGSIVSRPTAAAPSFVRRASTASPSPATSSSSIVSPSPSHIRTPSQFVFSHAHPHLSESTHNSWSTPSAASSTSFLFDHHRRSFGTRSSVASPPPEAAAASSSRRDRSSSVDSSGSGDELLSAIDAERQLSIEDDYSTFNMRETDEMLEREDQEASSFTPPRRFTSRGSSPVARRTPSITEVVSMSPQQLVFGFTSSDAQLDETANMIEEQKAHQREMQRLASEDGEYPDDVASQDSLSPTSIEPLINEITGWMLASSSGARKEKQRLMDMPSDEALFFSEGRQRDLVNWNTLIRVCAAKGQYEQGMQHWKKMTQLGMHTDMKTYVALITLCGIKETENEDVNKERLAKAWSLLEEYKSKNNGRTDESLFNSLCTTAGRLAGLDASFKVFDAMKSHQIQPTHVIYTELINVCRKAKLREAYERAEKLWGLMCKHGGAIEPDTRTYNVMIRTAGEAGATQTAIRLFNEMREKHYMPDAHTYSALIHACSKSHDSYSLTFEYFTDFIAQGFKPTIQVYNTLLHACARQGDVANALNLWSLLSDSKIPRDTVVYNTMLDCIANSMKVDEVRKTVAKKDPNANMAKGFGVNDDTDDLQAQEDKSDLKLLSKDEKLDKEQRITMAMKLYEQMKQTNVAIDLRTINSLVKVVSVAGRLKRVLQIQNALFETHKEFKPDIHSYAMIFTMYLEASRFPLALEHIDKMHAAGFKGTKGMYTSMLRKLSKPHKKFRPEELESYGQQVIGHMEKDGVEVGEEDRRMFFPELLKSHLKSKYEDQLRTDTVKTGLVATYSQREDAMIRQDKNRKGSARTGNQKDRFLADPKLALYRQKRDEREAEKIQKARGFKPKKIREQQQNLGHDYPSAKERLQHPRTSLPRHMLRNENEH